MNFRSSEQLLSIYLVFTAATDSQRLLPFGKKVKKKVGRHLRCCYQQYRGEDDHHPKPVFPFLSSSVPPSGPQNLRVSEEWYNRLRITWDPPSSPVKGYRIVYKPVSGK